MKKVVKVYLLVTLIVPYWILITPAALWMLHQGLFTYPIHRFVSDNPLSFKSYLKDIIGIVKKKYIVEF